MDQKPTKNTSPPNTSNFGHSLEDRLAMLRFMVGTQTIFSDSGRDIYYTINDLLDGKPEPYEGAFHLLKQQIEEAKQRAAEQRRTTALAAYEAAVAAESQDRSADG